MDPVQTLVSQIIGVLSSFGVYDTFSAGLRVLIISGLAFFVMRVLTGSR